MATGDYKPVLNDFMTNPAVQEAMQPYIGNLSKEELQAVGE